MLSTGQTEVDPVRYVAVWKKYTDLISTLKAPLATLGSRWKVGQG